MKFLHLVVPCYVVSGGSETLRTVFDAFVEMRVAYGNDGASMMAGMDGTTAMGGMKGTEGMVVTVKVMFLEGSMVSEGVGRVV